MTQISGIREDTKFLRFLEKTNVLSKSDKLPSFKKVITSPLFVFPPLHHEENAKLKKAYDETILMPDEIFYEFSQLPANICYIENYLSNGVHIFDEGNVSATEFSFISNNNDAIIGFSIAINEGLTLLLSLGMLDLKSIFKKMEEKAVGKFTELKDIIDLAKSNFVKSNPEERPVIMSDELFVYKGDKFIVKMNMLQETENSEFRLVSEVALQNFNDTIKKVALMNKFARENDLHPVLSEKISPDNGNLKRQNWMRTDLPRLLYLNKFPTTNEPSEYFGGTHASPRRHQRRGHYKTLKHQRYRNHPMYMVENGIYIRPTWVGDVERIVEGTRYTVYVPPEE